MHIDGILPKGPYPPCVSMADRALLAGYSRYVLRHCKHTNTGHQQLLYWSRSHKCFLISILGNQTCECWSCLYIPKLGHHCAYRWPRPSAGTMLTTKLYILHKLLSVIPNNHFCWWESGIQTGIEISSLEIFFFKYKLVDETILYKMVGKIISVNALLI